MTYSINRHPLTVTRKASGIVITGRLDTDVHPAERPSDEFVVILRSRYDANEFLICLQTAGHEAQDDTRYFGVLAMGDRMPVRPEMMCRHVIAWTQTEPTTDLEAAVYWIGWSHHGSADFKVTLDLAAAGRLYDEVSALVDSLPATARGYRSLLAI